MALALYRKYRPRTFAEVIGQEHVTEPLSQALRSGRLHHAYLFSGPRGCGKTSSARILARSLNCEQGPTPEPCGVCLSCRSLMNDGAGSIDVIEIDAASHGGVDDARELREKAFFAPANSRYKIYVIDEAHMVSSAGFNALLKLVEEPPEYVKFIFATTEPEKVLGTIRSRTHHYPFRLIPPAVLRPYLQQLTEAEGVHVEPAVLPLVVRAGGGSARDSLSVLDQLIAGAGPDGVSYSRAVALLGVTDVTLIDEMCDALAAGDGAAAYQTIDRVAEAGHDPRRFASDLLERFRDLIILQQVPDAVSKGLIDGPADQLETMTAQAGRLGPATLSRCADIVHNGLVEMRGTTAPRLLLELVTARMLLPGAEDSTGSLLQRLERMERRLTLGGELLAVRDEAAPVAPAVSAAPSVADAGPVESAPPGAAGGGGGGGGGGAKAAALAAAAAASRKSASNTGNRRSAMPAASSAPEAAGPAPVSPAAPASATAATASAASAAPASAAAEPASSRAATNGAHVTAEDAGSVPDPEPYDDEPPWDDEPDYEPMPEQARPVAAVRPTAPELAPTDGLSAQLAEPAVAPAPGQAAAQAPSPASVEGQTSAEGQEAAQAPAAAQRSAAAQTSASTPTSARSGQPAGLLPDAPEEPGAAAVADIPGQLTVEAVREVWPEIITAIKRQPNGKIAGPMAASAVVRALDGDTVVLVFQHQNFVDRISRFFSLITDALYETLGGRWQIRCEVGTGGGGVPAARVAERREVPPNAGRAPARNDAAAREPAAHSQVSAPPRAASGAQQSQAAAARPPQTRRQETASPSAADDEWPEPAKPGGLTAPATQEEVDDEEDWPEVRQVGGPPPAAASRPSPASEALSGAPSGIEADGGASWPSAAPVGGRPAEPAAPGDIVPGDHADRPDRGDSGATGQPAAVGSTSGQAPHAASSAADTAAAPQAAPTAPATAASAGPHAAGTPGSPRTGIAGYSEAETAGPQTGSHAAGAAPHPAAGPAPGLAAGTAAPGLAAGTAAPGLAAGTAAPRPPAEAATSRVASQAAGAAGAVGLPAASSTAETAASRAAAQAGGAAGPRAATQAGGTAAPPAADTAAPAGRAGRNAGAASGAGAARAALAAARQAAATRPAGAASGPPANRAWADGSPTEEAPYDPDYDGAPPAGGSAGFEGFDPGDEPLDEVIDEKTARESSEQQAMRLLRELLGAEKIGES
ncbi:DNA polymerase III subunit gamma and tau [Paractinoplanes toevensis]|uniref:DNA polymerase III subunit gamma/tau n=1 Tax=Paractinoplanes toevensis TaxID=571911 RepID=A0A919TGT9_9ACTN|nr:DNA polymerase III subunit gamma and tau [Actinoplanes toevensis]GIM95077.1 hypothetical protein Ato02nite_068700 [Actinoplanes toevensis]